jgi:succinate dehydrogenase / fumarate reductase iron-sulfur subunit
MAVCGSCGMRVDGGAALACKTPMKKFVDAGHRITVSPMGNLPVIKDLVVDMAPFWQKIRAVKPYLDTKDVDVPAKEWRVTQEASDQIHKESLCILCGCCVSECNSMESDPEFLGPAALAKAYRFVGDARDQDTRERLRDLNGAHGIWDCTRCYFCNQRCPKHVDPRDAIAKLGAESFKEGFTRDEGAKHAKVFVDSTYKGGYLRETELVPKTIGPINAIKDIPFALQLARAGKVPNPLSPHKAKDNDEVKRLWKLLEKEAKGQPRRATAKHPDAVQGD